jgi:hypothetical protein
MEDVAHKVPDETWEDPSQHDVEQALASLILEIAATNAWDQLNLSTTRRLWTSPLPS